MAAPLALMTGPRCLSVLISDPCPSRSPLTRRGDEADATRRAMKLGRIACDAGAPTLTDASGTFAPRWGWAR